MAKGTVKWFNKEKGFGFISPDEGGRDLYVQSTHLEPPLQTLDDGQRVEFDFSIGRKGPEATRVRPL